MGHQKPQNELGERLAHLLASSLHHFEVELYDEVPNTVTLSQ
jgi:hypothetical protein